MATNESIEARYDRADDLLLKLLTIQGDIIGDPDYKRIAVHIANAITLLEELHRNFERSDEWQSSN